MRAAGSCASAASEVKIDAEAHRPIQPREAVIGTERHVSRKVHYTAPSYVCLNTACVHAEPMTQRAIVTHNQKKVTRLALAQS